MSDITAEALRQEVLRIADAEPDYVYPSVPGSYYTGVYNETPEQPCCIFGKALINLGEPVPSRAEGNGITAVLRNYYDFGLDFDYSFAFSEVQRRQDGKVPWGEAVASLRDDNA